jgi:integrase
LIRRATDSGKGLSSTSIKQHHTTVHSALQAALLDGLVYRNVAKLVKGKPKTDTNHLDVQVHCWDSDEAKAFLRAAKAAGPQAGAFYATALDSGARKAELCGLRWSDLDWTAGTLTIRQQLSRKTTTVPVFGPTKTKKARVIDLGPETLVLLRKHHAHQAELKMANRTTYHEHGLVFAKEWEDLQQQRYALGDPLQMTNIGKREFARLTKAAGVRVITFHGLRHTSATLLLKAGVPPKVVQERLGHQSIAITMDVYAHVLPGMQQEAAAKLGALLHG